MHVVVVHAHVELIYILNRLLRLLLVGAVGVVSSSSTGQGDWEILGRFWVEYFIRLTTATFPVAFWCRYTLLLLLVLLVVVPP